MMKTLTIKLASPLVERGPFHPSPDEGHAQTSHVQQTGQVSGYVDDL